MSNTNFKTHIENIRKEALSLGYSISTMNDYLNIWNNFIKWKNENNFIYDKNEYDKFLLEYYNFDINAYTNKSKSHYQQLMRSKRILEDFDSYKKRMQKQILPKALYNNYPSEWNLTLDNYLKYLEEVRCNAKSSIVIKQQYLEHLLSYFSQNKIENLSNLTRKNIINFINKSIDSGRISKRRFFYVLRDFLNYLFIEGILIEDLSVYVPTSRNKERKKFPTYLKQDDVESLLSSIPKERKIDIRNYAIILIAARLGLRISDILNIKLKDIDWKNHKFKVLQPKNNNLNVLPLSNEIGWAIINYIKNARPKTNNEYLFVIHKYPFKKMEQFSSYNKYFEKVNIEIEDNHKKGIHELRHTFATNLLEHEIPIDIIANSLGDSIETTSNTYLKVDKKGLKSCGLELSDNEL